MFARSFTSIAAATSLAVVATACDPVMIGVGIAASSGGDPGAYTSYPDSPEFYEGTGYGENPAMEHFDDALSGTALSGALDQYTSGADARVSVTAFRYEGYSDETVTLLARGRTAMMLQVTVEGGLDAIPMGTSEGAPFGGLGCAGRDPANWVLDIDSDAVRFERLPTDDPDVDTIVVEADFDDQTLVGSFDYDRTLR